MFNAFGDSFSFSPAIRQYFSRGTTTWQLRGSYNLPQAKLFAQYGQVDNDSTNHSYSITGVGAAVPLTGAGKVLVQFGRLDPKVGATRNTWSLGYGHFLRKRSDLYTSYMNDKVSGMAAGDNYAVGVRHRF